MLTHLRIENLALVEKLAWEPGPGLVGITGETGAGKSVILGGLNLVLGERADRSLLRSGTDRCTVEAVFDLADTGAVDAILEESGLAPCEDGQLVLKRTFTAAGSNRQFVNCSPATLQVLKRLGDHLVDLHGPHDHQSLLSRERQLDVVDAYAGAAKERTAYREAWQHWQATRRTHAELREAEQASRDELDLLRHKAEEISAANIDPEEETRLIDRHRRATHAAHLAELSGQLANLLSESDDALLNRLAEAQRLGREIERTDPAAAEHLAGLAGAALELEETATAIRDYLADLNLDPEETRTLEERVNLLESLKRKYGPELSDVIAAGQRAEERLRSIENRDDDLARLAREEEEAAAAALKTATALSAIRRKGARRLGKEIARNLTALGFEQAGFSADLEKCDPGPHGAESADFLFTPNPGEPARPLRLIASSGEISRVMLAVKAALAEKDAVPVLVFDEIDANVGGEIATAVGARMAALATTHQVISITHLPQVASQADRQFVVAKHVENDRTHSRLHLVTDEARVEELARMLGGRTASALDHARALLEGTHGK